MRLTRQQMTLLGIFSLFLAPLLLVFLMRSDWWGYQPAGLRNQGYLVQAPVQLSLDLSVEGKWLLVYLVTGPCERRCTDDITSLRQIHKAAGRQRKHLAIVVLNVAGSDPDLQSRLESIYPDLNFVEKPSTETIAQLEQINSVITSAEKTSNDIQTYILDPMQNVILAFSTDHNPNQINTDLKRLLKWSKVDKVP